MDFNDNDIGNFGLPPLNNNNKASSRLSRSKKVVRGTKTVKPKKCAQKNDNNNMNQQQPHRRYNATKNSSIGRTMNTDNARRDDSDSSSSDDDDEIALSDLAPPPRKLQNSSSSRRAVVTPAASFFSNKPTLQHSRSNHGKPEGRTNKKNEGRNGEGQHRKKLKRQIGLDSFLQDNKKRQSTNITTTHDDDDDDDFTNNSEAEGEMNQFLLLSQYEVDSRSYSSSTFVTASSLLGGNAANNEKEVVGQDNTSSMLQNQRNKQEEAVADSKAATSSNSADDEIDEFDDDLVESKNGNKSCTKEENSSNNHHHPKRFGIHSLILGQSLPIMHPEEYYRAASTASTAFTSADTTVVNQAGGVVERRQQQQQNSPINRNILSHLLQRTYCPKSSSTSTSNLLTRYIHSNTTNQSSSSTNESVQLSTSSSSNNNNCETCAMAFDTMGILLAMGNNRGKIDIFDFDEVYAADLNKRNEWSRHCYEYQVGTAASVGQDRDDDHGDDDIEESDSTTDTNHGDNAEDEGAENTGEDPGNNTVVVPPLPPNKVNPVHSFQCQFIRGNATRNNNYLNSANRPRISGIYWNPDNQDHLAVSFENKSEIHLYDVASSKVPPPCLRVGESSFRGANGMGRQQHQRCEGVLSMRFIHSPAKKDGKSSLSGSTQIITGGVFGSVRLWSIPSTKLVGKRRRRCCISEVNAKCIWSMPVFGSSADGVSDILILPVISSHHATSSTATTTKPLVLLSGGASSTLVLLDTNKCTRKAFSTSITPTVAASWNLHQLASRELAKVDAKACIPDRRWMSVRNMRLIEYRRLTEEGGSWWCKIGMVTNAGWVFVAELVWKKNKPRLSICIVHHTPRIQCFNSSNERLTILGGMALQYSLPNAPVPSSDCVRMLSNNMIWVADVKGKKYTMPSKDKYVLCEDHNTLEVLEDEVVSRGKISESSSENGIILVSMDTVNKYDGISSATRNVVTRLSLPSSSRAPLALEIHPSGEWMAVGFGKDDSTGLKLIRLRKNV